MEVEIKFDDINHSGKVYKERYIYLSALIGGPLALGYLIAKNFKVFEDKEKVALTWTFTIFAMALFLCQSYLFREKENTLSQVLPIGYTILFTFLIVNRFQGRHITEYINQGGKFYSVRKAILIGIISLAITLILFLGTVYFLN